MKIPNKRELKEIASNHSSEIDFKDFMKLYKEYTKGPYEFLVIDYFVIRYFITIYKKLIIK